MAELIDIFSKILLPILALTLTIIGLKSRWVIKTDILFERYSKLSKFTYELSTQLNDEKLKEISSEYGYAAITREKGLTRDERYALLNMINPVEGIEEYHTCSDYLKINVVDSGFGWKRKRYNNTLYRRAISFISSTLYFIGAIMLFSPIFYLPLQESFIGTIFHSLSFKARFGLTIYIMAVGAIILVPSLNKLSKLYRASKLIESTNQLH